MTGTTTLNQGILYCVKFSSPKAIILSTQFYVSFTLLYCAYHGYITVVLILHTSLIITIYSFKIIYIYIYHIGYKLFISLKQNYMKIKFLSI